MASSTVYEYFLCHFCFNKFPDQSLLISHFPHCHVQNPTKRNDEISRMPRLNKTDRDILQMLKLYRLNDKSNHPRKPKDTTNLYSQLPLSMDSIKSSKQSSFDDSICQTTNSILINDNYIEQENISNSLNTKLSSSYHTYKYSRRERKNFYASVKRARLKKHVVSTKRTRTNSLIFDKKSYSINIPTQINSRQKYSTNSNNSYPLIFDPNFNILVQKSENNLLKDYFFHINSSFHLIHSIASQEFQTIVNSNDNQHHVSYTAFSFLNLLRQTMTDYSINLQKTFKRNYFQSFQQQSQPIISSFKIPRYDQSMSSSSYIQIDDNPHHHHHHHHHIPTERTLPSTPVNNSFLPIVIDHSVNNPVPTDLTLIEHEPSIDLTNKDPSVISFIPTIEEQTTNRNPTPIFLKEQKLEPVQNDELCFPIERARIRVINGSNQNKKSSPSRKKPSNPTDKIDENSMTKSIRRSTRHNSIKAEVIQDFIPSFETKPVILSSNQISKEWLTNTVFYRCHACSHEEFFSVLSRECMNLHISSHHGNMEENFKQRLSHFLNNKGRSLKIFQHYLKWQQPWSDKQIEQIFKLSNKS